MSFYYKPLLPTRAFQKTSEKLLEIFFQDTNDKIITDYIPIYKDSSIDISYSNIKLKNKKDISKLKKLTLDPNSIDTKNSFKLAYENLVRIFLSDPLIIKNLFEKDSDLSWILEKDIHNIGSSYVQKIKYLNADFFEEGFCKKNGFIFCNKDLFQTIPMVEFDYNSVLPKLSYVYLAQDFEIVHSKLYLNGGNSKFTSIKTDANLVLANIIFSVIYSEELETIFNSFGSSKAMIKGIANKIFILLNSTTPLPMTTQNNLEEMEKIISFQKEGILYPILEKSDKYLLEYETLDFQNRENSYKQDAKGLNITSKYLYYDKNFKFFTHKNKDYIAENIFKKIVLKLKDDKLKSLLKIYSEVEETNKFDYVISAMNIVYMLCECRTNLDNEAKENSCFNPLLSHIYDFMVDMTKKRIALSEDEKTKILTDYNISESYITMFAKNYLFAATYSENYRINATNFTDKFKTNSLKNKFEKPNYKFVYEKEQNLKSQEREFYETLKNMEGYTSKINEILEKIEDENKKKYYIIHNSNAILKSFSNVFIVLRIADFIIFDEDKTSKDYADFAKDVTDLTNTIAGVIALKGSKTSIETIQSLSKAIYETNNSKTFLSNITFANRVAIITTIITTIYDMNELYKKEDYDAMFLTLFISGTTLALLFFSPALPITVVTILLNIINMAILTQIKDSDLKIYLQKSLLFKKDIGVFEVFFQNKEKRYKTHYLLEAVKTIDNLKTKVNDGFNDPTKIIDFIGRNYLSYEKYFDMALTNELSFLKANLLGYKLELLPKKRDKKISIYGRNVTLEQNTFIKISKNLYSDKDSIFIFETGGKYKILDKNTIIKPEKDYYVFNLYHQDFKNLNDLKSLDGKKASIIVLSSIVDLKYSFTYDLSGGSDFMISPLIEANDFKQSSFTIQDTINLEKIKNNK